MKNNKFVLKISERPFSKLILNFLFPLILLTITCDDNTQDSILSTWIQMGASGSIISRAITENSECPFITLNNTIQQMQVRAEPSEPDFPVLVCEILIPPNTNSAFIDGERLHLPKPKLNALQL